MYVGGCKLVVCCLWFAVVGCGMWDVGVGYFLLCFGGDFNDEE